jgi:hypothetical protein
MLPSIQDPQVKVLRLQTAKKGEFIHGLINNVVNTEK